MRITDNVFDLRNVPKVLLVIAAVATIIMVWGVASPDVFGRQPVMIPFMIIACGVLWFLVYWTGTSKTRVKAADEPLPPVRHEPEVMPDFQEYMAAEEWMEEHPDAMPAAMPPKKGSHKYDARV